MMGIEQIAKKYNAEIALIVLLLRIKIGTAKPADIQLFFNNNAPDLDYVLVLVKAHELTSVIFSIKEGREIFSTQKKDIQILREVDMRGRNNLLILSELVHLSRYFREQQMSVIFYKGVLLSKILFDDFTTRATSDIDIMIRSGDFFKIREILLSSGYEEVYYYPENYPVYFLLHTRESAFRKKITGKHYIYVELQWSPLPEHYGIPYNNDYFFSHTEQLLLTGESVNTLHLTQHLFMLMIHHGLSDLWRNIKHVFDIAIFIKRYNDQIDWKELYKMEQNWHISNNCSCGWSLVYNLFGAGSNSADPWRTKEEILKPALDSLLGFPLLPKDKKNIQALQRQLLLCDGRKERNALLRGYLKIALWPSLIDLENIKLPKVLFPLYFITKRFRFLFKKE